MAFGEKQGGAARVRKPTQHLTSLSLCTHTCLTRPQAQIANSNVAAVMGGVAARLFIGKFMDSAGPRMAFLLCLWGTVPFIIGISFVKSFAAYAACRFFMAMALAAVIPCIQWTTMMCVAALRQSSRRMSCMRRAKKGG
jgi:MFS family permease